MGVSFTVDAEPRTDLGKGASRRLRRTDQVPAVVYGAGAEPQAIMVKHNQASKSLDQEAFYSHILTLNVGKKSQQVILRDVQRHPYKQVIMHMDFQRVKSDQTIQMNVPLHFTNEDHCIGVKLSGGVISHIESEILIECLPADLPEYIDVDMTNVDLGDSLHLSDISLPEGVSSVDLAYGEDRNRSIVSVYMAREEILEDEDQDEEGIVGEVADEPEADEED